ncbi:hypothetical protein ES705_42528 [subsurface metagenome]
MDRQALAIRVDVSDSKEVNQMVRSVLKKFKRVDILVNNAAIIKRGSIEDLTEEDWDRVMDVNLKGAFNCAKAVVGIMKKQRYGKIVNISSIAGKIGDLASAPCYGADFPYFHKFFLKLRSQETVRPFSLAFFTASKESSEAEREIAGVIPLI